VKKLAVATNNKGKIKEIEAILEGLGIELVSLSAIHGAKLPPETETTFQGNALLKARAIASTSGIASLADDSGLEVDALKGAPGVYSARYAGENATDEANNQKLLGALKNVPKEKRSARFVCSIALVLPGGEEFTFEGTMEGTIAFEEKGANGFGYDPLFIPAGMDKTSAELSYEEKNRISHRGKALEKFKSFISSSRNPLK